MIEASVSGIPFCNVSLEIWNQLGNNMELELVREPTNQWDKNAIKVLYKKQMLGYIEKEIAKDVAGIMDEGNQVTCKIIAKRNTPNDKPILAVGLYL